MRCSRFGRSWSFVFAVLVTACVGDDPKGTDVPDGGSTPDGGVMPTGAPKITSFTATPATLPYGGGVVKLAFSVEGATSATIDNAVGDVLGKATVDANVAKTTTYTLTATNAAGTTTGTAKIDVAETITVQGKLVAGGQPVVNAAVVVGGQPSTTTSSVGTFTVAGVKPPYDVVIGAGSPVAVTVYKGLTRVDPTLVAFAQDGPAAATYREAQEVDGTVSGGATPYTEAPVVSVSGPNRTRGTATAVPTNGNYSMTPSGLAGPVSWRGPATTTATFHAYTVLAGVGWYGKLENVALVHDGGHTGQNIAMNQLTMTDVACTGSAPQGFDPTFYTLDCGVRFTALGGGYSKQVPGAALPRTGTVSLHPVSGATFFAEASYNTLQPSEDQSFARKSVSAGTKTIAVALVAPPQATAPADAATNVTAATAFTFGALAGGVQRISFTATAAPTVTIVTKDTTATLPDLTPFGAALPKNTLYTWRVFAYAPVGGLDDAKLADTLDVPDGTVPPLDDVQITAAKPRTLTTAP